MYIYLKALHIIFVVTWFAGLFYMVRLFIYHVEAQEKGSPEREILSKQFSIMERRLWYGITWPSSILTIIFGGGLLHHHMPLSDNWWLVAKLVLVFLLLLYHLSCGRIYKQISSGVFTWSSLQLRVWNEVATIFLFAIVFLVELKSTIDMGKGMLGVIALSIVLMLGIKIYRKLRVGQK